MLASLSFFFVVCRPSISKIFEAFGHLWTAPTATLSKAQNDCQTTNGNSNHISGERKRVASCDGSHILCTAKGRCIRFLGPVARNFQGRPKASKRAGGEGGGALVLVCRRVFIRYIVDVLRPFPCKEHKLRCSIEPFSLNVISRVSLRFHVLMDGDKCR